MNDKEVKEITESLSNIFFDKLVHSLFKDGTITISDFDDKEKLMKKILKINDKTDYKLVIDHTENLLNTARHFYQIGEIITQKYFTQHILSTN